MYQGLGWFLGVRAAWEERDCRGLGGPCAQGCNGRREAHEGTWVGPVFSRPPPSSSLEAKPFPSTRSDLDETGTLATSRPPPSRRGAACLVIVRFHCREEAIRHPSVASLQMPSSQPLCLPSLKGGVGWRKWGAAKSSGGIVGMPRMLADPAEPV